MTTEKQQTKKKVTDFYSMESAMYTRIYRELDMLDSMTFDILLRSFQKRLDKDTVTRIKSSRNKASSLMAALHDFLVTVPEAYEIIVKCDKKMPLAQLLLDSYSDEIMPNSSSSTPPPPPPPSSSSSAQITSTNSTSNKSGAFLLSTVGSDGSNGNESNERGTTTTTTTTGLVVGELVPEAMSLLKASPASTTTTPVFSTSAQLQTPPPSSSSLPAAAASTSIYSLLNSDSSTHLLIEIFESIMPVYYEPAPVTLADDPSQGHYKAWSISKPRWGGRFDLVHLPERNMSLKRKLFLNEFDYLREMKMVKHRHQNLYTAEFIFKGFNDKNLYLLYSLESYTSMFLNELAAQIKSTQEPSEYDAMQQLGLLRDISGALAYLHEATDHKEKILHGNLLPENIIVEMTLLAGKTVYVPKLYNFENAIEISRQEVDMYDTQIKEELFNFGLIIFLVLGWTPLNKKECEQMHRENSNRIELYERLKLEAPDPYNAFKYRLFKRFCVLTAPTTVGASTTSSSNLARPTTTSSAASQNNDMIGIHKNIKKTWNDYNNIFS